MVLLKDAESLVGTLNHCALVLPDGRSHLPSLYHLLASFHGKQSLVRHRVSDVVASDVDWWRVRLSGTCCVLKIKALPLPSPVAVFVDASTSWGIGFVMGESWLAWKLKPGWKSDDCDIGWAEMVAVYLALTALIASNAHFILRSDNKGVCGAFEAGCSHNVSQNIVLGHTVSLFREYDIWFLMLWVPTKENIADGPSRGLLPPSDSILHSIPTLPHHLRDWVHKPVRRETYASFS
jgi:hypothetical protein